MATSADASNRSSPPGSNFPVYGIYLVVAAALVVLAVMASNGALSKAGAVLGMAVAVGGALLARALLRSRADIGIRSETGQARAGDDLLAAIVAGLPDPTIALDGEGRVAAFNAPASAIAPALRRGELVSIALRVPEVVDAIRRVSASGKAERVEFAERVPADRWSEAHLIPVGERGESALSRPMLLLTFHDLTPIRRVEEMRADFVANASHELRTPLAALSGFIETLKGPARDDPAARARFLDIMHAQATRMARLIDDLLSLSRIELAAHVRPVTPVELAPVVRQVIDSLQTLARDRGVEVAVKTPAEPLVVPADRDELIRVFENLIENALKYGASGKRVEITLSQGAGEAVASVRDYGPGISAEHLPRLTERFYRVDVAGSRAQGGTGLGLALVKHILNRHRGRLAIEIPLGRWRHFHGPAAKCRRGQALARRSFPIQLSNSHTSSSRKSRRPGLPFPFSIFLKRRMERWRAPGVLADNTGSSATGQHPGGPADDTDQSVTGRPPARLEAGARPRDGSGAGALRRSITTPEQIVPDAARLAFAHLEKRLEQVDRPEYKPRRKPCQEQNRNIKGAAPSLPAHVQQILWL